MKITRRQLKRIVREAINPQASSSLASRAAQEFAQLSPDDVDMINASLTSIHPDLDLHKIFGQQAPEYIDLDTAAMTAFQERFSQISEFVKMLSGNESESITDYIQSILAEAIFLENGSILRRTFYKGEQRHRDGDKPALISYDDAGNPIQELWYQNGIQHRDGDKPAAVHKSKRGFVETYFKQGKKHRDGDKPAIFSVDASGKIKDQVWIQNGIQHREGDKPTRIMNGVYGILIQYKKDNALHREGDKPAEISANPDGQVVEEKYYKKGVLHREEGKPASILYNNVGDPIFWEFWVDGEEKRHSDSSDEWNEKWGGKTREKITF